MPYQPHKITSPMLTLDFKTITDEILALTALRKATAANPDEGMLVTRDQLPGLRVLARMVFAEILLRLGPAVETSDIDDSDIPADHPYSASEAPAMRLTLAGADRLSSGALITVRRHLEHAVATGILAWIATEGPDSCSGFAAELRARSDAAVSAVADTLASLALSDLRAPGWPQP